MSADAPPPDQPLRIVARGLATVEDLKKLLADLGPRVGIRTSHLTEPVKAQVKGAGKTLRYFQPDKTTGVAKVLDLARIHQLLLKAVPAGVTRPYRARKTSGTLHRRDLLTFHSHWLGVFKTENESNLPTA